MLSALKSRPSGWAFLYVHTCIEAGAVSDFFMLSFAGVADDEGDASRLRLSEGLCLELSIIRTRKAATFEIFQ